MLTKGCSGFSVCFNVFVPLFVITPCLTVAVQTCMEWIPIKKKYIKKRSWVINKNVKNECGETQSFCFFANNSRYKQNEKYCTPFCRHW